VAPINHPNRVVLEVNWLGTKSLTEQVLPKIKPSGSVTTVASRAGANWEANVIQLKRFLTASNNDVTRICDLDSLTPARAYELSKELLIYWSMTQSATQQSIRFNTVSPSSVETRLTPCFREAFKNRKINNNDLRKRSTTPDEIAEAIWFLANPEARSISGIDLKVDQGITAQRKIAELEHNRNGE
jgi:NAD(P)-dependent dehydrogenase (short-subunit alcohol dehydrogenase family)